MPKTRVVLISVFSEEAIRSSELSNTSFRRVALLALSLQYFNN